MKHLLFTCLLGLTSLAPTLGDEVELTSGETVSGADGSFTIPFRKVGGGVLMYDVGITVRRNGYQPATLQFKLPPGARRLLVIMTPGPDRMGDPDADDPLKQYERYR